MPHHLALPIKVTASGRLAAVEQDSSVDIAQSVALLLSTEPGERRSVPDYGMADALGAGDDLAAVADAITSWEERADPAEIESVLAGALSQLRVFPSDQPTVDTEEA